jgi:hypothetical protein
MAMIDDDGVDVLDIIVRYIHNAKIRILIRAHYVQYSTVLASTFLKWMTWKRAEKST